MTPPRGREGFVLPVALVVMVLASIIASTILFSARSDLRSARTTRAAAVALAAADAGAARTLALWSTVVPVPPDPGDSLDLGWEALPDGSHYRVVLYRTPVDNPALAPSSVIMYVTGVASARGIARRTVGMVVDPGTPVNVCCDAALEVTGPVEVSGSLLLDVVPEVDGRDVTPLLWVGVPCPATSDVTGAAAPSAGDVQEGANATITGNPPVEADASLTPWAFGDFGGGVNWADLVRQATVQLVGNQSLSPAPTLAGLACDVDDDTNWGDPLAPLLVCGDHFPTVHVDGDLTMTGGLGQGMLLVEGDLVMEGTAAFYGIVLVLGTADIRGDAAIHGGIKVRNGPSGTGTSRIRDLAKLHYSSCAVSRSHDAVNARVRATEEEWFEVIG